MKTKDSIRKIYGCVKLGELNFEIEKCSNSRFENANEFEVEIGK